MLCTHKMASLGVGKEDAGKGGRGIQGRTRDYISEQAGEADLIQVWDFALTPGRCVLVDQRGIALIWEPSRVHFWNCAMPRVSQERTGRMGQRCEMGVGASMTRRKAEAAN